MNWAVTCGAVVEHFDDLLDAMPRSRQLGNGATVHRVQDGVLIARTLTGQLPTEERQRRLRHALATVRGTP